TSTPQGACDYIDADLRDPVGIVTQAARTLDFTQPVGVLLLAVLHFIPDTDDPAGLVATLAARLAPGSSLAISHLTADLAPRPGPRRPQRLQHRQPHPGHAAHPRPGHRPVRRAAAAAVRGGPGQRMAQTGW